MARSSLRRGITPPLFCFSPTSHAGAPPQVRGEAAEYKFTVYRPTKQTTAKKQMNMSYPLTFVRALAVPLGVLAAYA
jgi:hypothetical protein